MLNRMRHLAQVIQRKRLMTCSTVKAFSTLKIPLLLR
jgi:hypothetical protein